MPEPGQRNQSLHRPGRGRSCCGFADSLQGPSRGVTKGMNFLHLHSGTVFALLLLLLISYGSSNNIHCSASVPEDSKDMASLVDFKQAITKDPNGVLNSWNTSIPFCQWMGVVCSRRHPDRVAALELGDQNLTGILTPSLGNLTFLRALNLSSNYFSGHLPHLHHLYRLKVLDLTSNLLQGVIPDTLTNCSSLQLIFLAYNFLQGEIPLNVGLLPNLESLYLSKNNLTGTIPPTLNNTRLRVIALANNKLTGVPHELGSLDMSILYLGGNMLLGGFPSPLFNMTSLLALDLGMNMLGGELPSYIGDLLPNLQLLGLDGNMFQGPIPASLGNVSSLALLNMSSNNFVGQVPTYIGMLSSLYYLNLEDNKLAASDVQGWEFLAALANCSQLTKLSLAKNQLSGAIPNNIGELSIQMEELFLNDNYLTGTVPPSMANLTGLIKLRLNNNCLRGTLP